MADITEPTTPAAPQWGEERPLIIVSFGYGHSAPPTADLTLDVRRSLRNPPEDPAVRAHMVQLTGLDPEVRAYVPATPGARYLVHHVAAAARGLPVTRGRAVVAVGCVGGRHRSVVLAEEIAAVLRGEVAVRVEHRDVHRPVIRRGEK